MCGDGERNVAATLFVYCASRRTVDPARPGAVPSRAVPDSPVPQAPYRTPWEPARRVVHPAAYATPAALRRELLDLRQRVDAGQLGDLSAEDLAQTIRELTEARDSLRGFARPTRGVLVTVAATFTGSGLLLAFLKMPAHAWAALGVAMVTAAVAALASEWAQRWLDAVPEYEGLIADLRKAGSAKPVSSDRFEDLLRVLQRMREAGMAHADLATGNVLIQAKHHSIRLVDFDWSASATSDDNTGVRVAPEAAGGDTPADEAEGAPAAKDDEKKRGER